MDETWVSPAASVAENLAQAVSASLEEGWLTHMLLMFTLKPKNETAAEMRIIFSPYEVILSAGRGTRFELDALPRSEDRLLVLAGAIASGGLSERIWPRRVKFELRLPDTVLRGGEQDGLIPRPGRSRSVSYAPYARQ